MAVPASVYKCDNNSYQFKASVVGGVKPFVFEIISSNPSSPSISQSQSNPQFIINNGIEYSLVRVRSVDACGNSATQDMSLLPLQNIKGYATDTCFYKNMKLSVDNIPDAEYRWYYVNEGVNTLVSNQSFYQAYFLPEMAGTYFCDITVYNDCIQRRISFDLKGLCYDHLSVNPLNKNLSANKKGGISLFPNPTRSTINISINQKNINDYKIEVISTANGMVLFRDELKSVSKKDYQINKKLLPGLYLIKVSNATTGEVETFKQVIL